MSPVCIFLGTRPEIIKMAPIVNLLLEKRKKFVLVHTNQHGSFEMNRIFFKELNLPTPNFNLYTKAKSHGGRFAEIVAKSEKIFKKVNPSCVLVEGDTDSVLAGAISAWKLGIKIGHVEAGLRSYDRTMPEELNRKVADHLGDFLFAPTRLSEKNLINEGIEKNKIFVSGNTIVDATFANLKLAAERPRIAEEENYILLTLHRPTNVDDLRDLRRIAAGIKALARKTGFPVYFPIHPRTQKMAKIFGVRFNKKFFRILPPVGYFDMLNLEKQAKLILTDSGGVQEEACILHVPCVTIRDNTERPETVVVGANIVVGRGKNIVPNSLLMLRRKHSWKNPFGEGDAAQKIIGVLEKARLV